MSGRSFTYCLPHAWIGACVSDVTNVQSKVRPLWGIFRSWWSGHAQAMLMRLSLLRETPPPWGIGRDLTFIKANCPWFGVNNWSNVYTTWSDKRSNACPTMVKRVASNNIHASNPHLIPTSPQGRGVSRNNDRCIRWP